jgi:hypothetical protein
LKIILNKFFVKLLERNQKSDRFFRKIPVYGFLLFAILFVYATIVYPGGSRLYPLHHGYIWTENYICDLSRTIALNGEKNDAARIDLFSMACLCFSIVIVVVNFSIIAQLTHYSQLILQICGTISMVTGMLLFSKLHYVVILPTLIFSLATLTQILIALRKRHKKDDLILGMFCVFLLIFNYAIFLSSLWIGILPILQKFTLLTFIIWLLKINFAPNQKKLKFDASQKWPVKKNKY